MKIKIFNKQQLLNSRDTHIKYIKSKEYFEYIDDFGMEVNCIIPQMYGKEVEFSSEQFEDLKENIYHSVYCGDFKVYYWMLDTNKYFEL